MAGEFKMVEHDGVLYRPEDFEALGIAKASPSTPVEAVQKESKPATAKAPAKKAPAKRAASTKGRKPANKAATPDGAKADDVKGDA